MISFRRLFCLLTALVLALPFHAQAQDYPTRPIALLVGLGAGGDEHTR